MSGEKNSAKTFKNHCTCGGYASSMNGRDRADPHMAWCPQREEYLEWYHNEQAKKLCQEMDGHPE